MCSALTARGVLAKPGDAIGILGGGQLGRMLSLAAADLGLDVHIFAPETDSPASRVSRKTFVAAWDDEAALREFAQSVNVCTLEFENVPTQTVDFIIDEGTPVRPDSRALAVAQDRLAEKSFFREIGVPPTDFRRIDKPDQIQPALDELGGRGILKTRFSGYDGKGQLRLEGRIDADPAWAQMQRERSILEAFVDFKHEISVILARGGDGSVAIYDSPQNLHSDGILRKSIFPAPLPSSVLDEAAHLAQKLADELDYIGVLALELFVGGEGRLVANEFAPRVHNSGHWTQDACFCGQFEQHIRAVCGWPLGDPTRHSAGEMDNIIGPEIHDWKTPLAATEHLHLYGKRRALDGRKMGHITRLKK